MMLRLRGPMSLALFLGASVALADDPEPPDHDLVTAERLQQALLKMKLDVEFGTMPKLSPEMLKRMTERLNPGEFSKLLDRVKDNPAFRKMLQEKGVSTPPNLAQDPKAMQAIKDAITRSLPPNPSTNPEPLQSTGRNTDIRVPDYSEVFRPELAQKLPIKPLERRFVDELRPPGAKNRPLTPEEQRRERTAKSLAKGWERMVGPINDNPSLRKALMEMVLAGEDLKGSDGSDLWKFLEENAGAESGQDFGDFLNGLDGFGSDWNFPKLDLSGLDFSGWNWNGSGGGPSGLDSPSSISTGSLGDGGFFGDSWAPVILFILVAIVSLLVWRFWSPAAADKPRFDFGHAGFGPWPVDPRRLASREDVVKAFEYLTVLRCGEESRTWNHLTIAITLGMLASDSTSAVQVARLYAQARYAPVADDFSTQDLADSRRHICHLAGVPTA